MKGGSMKADEPGKRPEPPRKPPSWGLPGFVREEAIGLGDVISRTAAAIGVRPCGGCVRRAEALNRWMTVGRKIQK